MKRIESDTSIYGSLYISGGGVFVNGTAISGSSTSLVSLSGFINNPNSSGVRIAGVLTNSATGKYSTAEGSGTTSSGDYSHAEGLSTVASSVTDHAEGRECQATGGWSHAEGYTSIASGPKAHAEGQSTAAGAVSHSEGFQTQANGSYSHAEGFQTIATGDYSHAAGQSSTASNANTYVWSDGTVCQDNGTKTYNIVATNGVHISGGLYLDGKIINKTWSLSGSNIYYNQGKVGIGVTVPTWELDVASVGSCFIRASRGDASSYSGYLIADENKDSKGYFQYSAGERLSVGTMSAIDLYIAPGNTETHIFKSDGKVGINNLAPSTALDVNGVITCTSVVLSGGQIKFPSTSVASSDANTLDDYEEGTFSPSLFFSSGQEGSFTHTVQTGTYTKMGNFVSGQISLTWTGIPSAGSVLQITNLPFACHSAGGTTSTIYSYVNSGAWNTSSPTIGIVNTSDTTITLCRHTGGSSSVFGQADIPSSSIMTVTYSYRI
jgi:hypothetical protein